MEFIYYSDFRSGCAIWPRHPDSVSPTNCRPTTMMTTIALPYLMRLIRVTGPAIKWARNSQSTESKTESNSNTIRIYSTVECIRRRHQIVNATTNYYEPHDFIYVCESYIRKCNCEIQLNSMALVVRARRASVVKWNNSNVNEPECGRIALLS